MTLEQTLSVDWEEFHLTAILPPFGVSFKRELPGGMLCRKLLVFSVPFPRLRHVSVKVREFPLADARTGITVGCVRPRTTANYPARSWTR